MVSGTMLKSFTWVYSTPQIILIHCSPGHSPCGKFSRPLPRWRHDNGSSCTVHALAHVLQSQLWRLHRGFTWEEKNNASYSAWQHCLLIKNMWGCQKHILPCSMCDRISLARVTLRTDSPWPVQDTAPLRLSAYPPQPGLHERHNEDRWKKTKQQLLPVDLVKSSCHTNDGRVSNPANHFISDPSSGGCTCDVPSRVDSNRPHGIVGPAGKETGKYTRILGVFDLMSLSLCLFQPKVNFSQFLPGVEIFPHACLVGLVFHPGLPLSFSHQHVSVDGGHADALSKQVRASAGQQQMGSLEYSVASSARLLKGQWRSDDEVNVEYLKAAPFPSPPVPGRQGWGCSWPTTQRRCQASVHPWWEHPAPRPPQYSAQIRGLKFNITIKFGDLLLKWLPVFIVTVEFLCLRPTQL